MNLPNDIMYNASFNKDASFEGVFWMGVKTTGIFCRPTCTARKPKPENVEFFSNTKDAILKGYRPCKVCKPLEKLNETPKYIQEIIDELVEKSFLEVQRLRLGKTRNRTCNHETLVSEKSRNYVSGISKNVQN